MKVSFKKNVGALDRALRISAGAVIIILAASGNINTAFIIIGALLLVTGITAYCPGYIPFGISTKRKKPGEPKWKTESNP